MTAYVQKRQERYMDTVGSWCGYDRKVETQDNRHAGTNGTKRRGVSVADRTKSGTRTINGTGKKVVSGRSGARNVSTAAAEADMYTEE